MKMVRLSDLRICRRSAYNETTFRRLKSALNKLMMMMMVAIIIIIITLTVVVVLSLFQSSRLTRIFLTQCAVLCLLRLQKLFQSLHLPSSPLGLITPCSFSFLFTEIKTKINKLRLGYKCYPKFIFSKQYSKFMTIIVGEIWVQGVLCYVCSHG
jgi:hypothetical protein